jgi:hypothetical protein
VENPVPDDERCRCKTSRVMTVDTKQSSDTLMRGIPSVVPARRRQRDVTGALTVTSMLLSLLFSPVSCLADDSCVYVTDQREIVSAKSLSDVPARYRAKAVCNNHEPKEIPKTEDVQLNGLYRTSSFSTDIGRMEVRWLRESERCFSKSPSRIVAEAASAVNRALKTARFATEAQDRRGDWSLVLVDKATAVSQFPMALSLGGHPGFMVPPDQIYIVVDYLVPACRAGSEGDGKLLQVLLHEMGHVIDFALMNGVVTGGDRKRSEGFASWFEGYASRYAAEIPKGSVVGMYRDLAQRSEGVGSPDFQGSGEDYGVAAMEFEAIVHRKGIAGLMLLYGTMRDDRCDMYEAMRKRFGWDARDLKREVKIVGASAHP